MKSKKKARVKLTDYTKILGSGIRGVRKPMTRIYEIHQAILTGKFPNCFELADEMKLERKTIQRDINYMRDELGMPIAYQNEMHGYYYQATVPEFPMFQCSTEEIAGLFIARNALETIRGTQLETALRKAFTGLTRGITGMVEMNWQDLDDAFSRKVQPQNPELAKTFGELAMAVLKTRVTHFEYKKLGAAEPELRKVHPLHLSEVDGGFYLIAHDTDRGELRTFALPRISAIKVTNRKFKRPVGFDPKEYLSKSFGIWNVAGDQTLHTVRVELKNYAARLATERTWHPSQEVKPLNTKGTRVEVCFEVGRLEEVLRWVMSFGSQAKVLAPAELANMVREEVAAMAGS
jgi:proteasome accessory factor B